MVAEMSRLSRSRIRPCRVPAAVLLAIVGAGAYATEPDASVWPDWVAEEERVRQRIAAVNEGDLAFLTAAPEAPVHHHRNEIAITELSLADGWVRLDQCHDHLDRVARAQIVFRPGSSRDLRVVSFRNIDAAFAEANAVQLRGIHAGSEVCVSLETRALQRVDTGVFELQNGPFMRRFLDGYYPLRVSMRIHYPTSLELGDFSPTAQPGFRVDQAPGQIEVEALFEGRLETRFRFVGD